MTLFKDDIGTEIRLETYSDDLATASSIIINVRKPSGSEVVWTATQYSDTSQISHITVSGDIDEVGEYILQAELTWADYVSHGDSAIITVYDELSTGYVNISELIRYFSIYYRFLTVQTFSEFSSDPQTGTDSDILYDSFNIYSDLALSELNNMLTIRSISREYIADAQYNALICHLIADYFEMGNPDWSFRSQSQAPGVSFSRAEKTGPRMAFEKLFDSIAKANTLSSVSCGRGANTETVRIKDAVNYPKRWKRTEIPAYNPFDDGFDEDEVEDMGYSDTTNSEWS